MIILIQTLDRLYYSVWINDELLIENQIITDAEEEFKMHQSRGFKIDLKDSEGVFELGENTIKLTPLPIIDLSMMRSLI